MYNDLQWVADRWKYQCIILSRQIRHQFADRVRLGGLVGSGGKSEPRTGNRVHTTAYASCATTRLSERRLANIILTFTACKETSGPDKVCCNEGISITVQNWQE